MDSPTPTEQEHPIKEVAQAIEVSLPGGKIPLPMKLLTLFTTIGGTGILAGVVTDIVRPQAVVAHFYLLRLSMGIAMILVAYGTIKRKRWTIWLYGGISIIGFFFNPLVAIIPLLITAYIYFQKDYFGPSIPDHAMNFFRRFTNRDKS